MSPISSTGRQESREGVEPSRTVLQTAILAGESARFEMWAQIPCNGRRHVRVGCWGCAERAEGVAPSLSVWKTAVLLLDDARMVMHEEEDRTLPGGATGNRTPIPAMRTQRSPVELSPQGPHVFMGTREAHRNQSSPGTVAGHAWLYRERVGRLM